METNFNIVPAMYEQNTFFLFRDYAIEIKFSITNGAITVIGKGYLLPIEAEFIKVNFSTNNLY